MKNLFENWRLFTEAKPTGKPPGGFSSWDDYWKWHTSNAEADRIAAAFADVDDLTVDDLKPPESIRRPSVKPTGKPPGGFSSWDEYWDWWSKNVSPPLPEPEDIGAGIPTGDPLHRRGSRERPAGAPEDVPRPSGGKPRVEFDPPTSKPAIPKGPKVDFHAAGSTGLPKEAPVDRLEKSARKKRKQINDVLGDPRVVSDLRGVDHVAAQDARIRALEIENEANRRMLDKNKLSGWTKLKRLAKAVSFIGSTAAALLLGSALYPDCVEALADEYPDMDEKEREAVALGIAVFDVIATDVIGTGEILMWLYPPLALTYQEIFPEGSKIPTNALLSALDIADKVNEIEERNLRSGIRKDMRREDYIKAKKAQRGDPRLVDPDSYLEPDAWSAPDYPEEETGPVPDEDLRENFKRVKKVKKLIIIIS